MANADLPQGFKPRGELKTATEYEAGSAIGIGDAVVMADDGQVDSVSGAYTGAVLGVALGSASAAGEKIMVADDPSQEYVIQADGADVDAQTDINLNYGITGTAASSGESRMELDSDTGATTATLPLKLLRIDARPDNALGAQVDCVVKINNHQLAGGTGTAGL